MRIRPLLPCVISLALLGCDSKSESPAPPPQGSPAASAPRKGPEPDHIEVDHILIGVENLSPTATFTGKRSAPAAKTVAYDLYERLKAGGDWAAAKKEFSEDPPPGGPYGMSNFGVKNSPGEYRREGMAPAFGNVGFQLAVGEIGVADYAPPKVSPFGFHIIKRTK